ncbi:biotin carboxylase N-terminal domain-containing protein [Ramlibacter sp.]|uniref:acetyl/propionyl/methylcrotonyl-CoA carboxylase subunit alpha n=1 Tax=Ramlibacter sp. TaxID=1917967 RepID=UPI0026159F96|nr:biotin carboxylase N-terminal domain-containing protein [Ramlibacter sp.]
MRRLLIANRGEIARRIMRTTHRMGIETVAVHSDADAQALHVREATRAQPLGGNALADTYLRIDKLLAAARATGADAVHPGYGFLSENAEFAQATGDAGLLWIGPGPGAIRTLGNKSRAKELAHARGIPCLPGYQGADQSEARLLAQADRIGFPLMVKAAAGGGGRGMRLVHDAAQLPAALESARSEAAAAFGSGELLLERALLRPRHVEIQVFADTHGNCIHLGERDCSVQRRHQKIIEESPSPAVDAALRLRMGNAAVELVRAAGYVGAGTVEFLLQDGEFFLMEMNTRLQVEHPVTEAVTGHDLVEWQLRIARGERLPCRQSELGFNGHAIEVRLCAEDENFRPRTGRVDRFLPPPAGEGGGSGGTLRFDHAIREGLQVTPFYDSMLGKLIAWAPTREQAIDDLATALDRLQVLGLPTNRRLLAACLRHPLFASGQALVPFLADHGDALRAALQDEERMVVPEAAVSALLPHGGAGALAPPFERPLRVRHHDMLLDVPVRESDGFAPAQAVSVRLDDGGWHLQLGAVDLFLADASFDPPAGRGDGAGDDELRAPFNGKVIALCAAPGDGVRKGEVLLVIESMKLEHAVTAVRDGVVKALHVEAGQQVATARVLVTFEAA